MSEPRLSGQYVEAMVSSFGQVSPIFEQKGREIFRENGIRTIDPEDWYPMENVAQITHIIETKFGEQSSQEAGIKQVEITDAFDGLTSIEEGVDTTNQVLRNVYQNYSVDDVGEFRIDRPTEGQPRVSVFGPYPYAEGLVKGIIIGLGKAGMGRRPLEVETASKERNESHAYNLHF